MKRFSTKGKSAEPAADPPEPVAPGPPGWCSYSHGEKRPERLGCWPLVTYNMIGEGYCKQNCSLYRG
ncbi:MAG: hypothetical protein WC551_09720 [Patescibacteria group bacterium]